MEKTPRKKYKAKEIFKTIPKQRINRKVNKR